MLVDPAQQLAAESCRRKRPLAHAGPERALALPREDPNVDRTGRGR